MQKGRENRSTSSRLNGAAAKEENTSLPLARDNKESRAPPIHRRNLVINDVRAVLRERESSSTQCFDCIHSAEGRQGLYTSLYISTLCELASPVITSKVYEATTILLSSQVANSEVSIDPSCFALAPMFKS